MSRQVRPRSSFWHCPRLWPSAFPPLPTQPIREGDVLRSHPMALSALAGSASPPFSRPRAQRHPPTNQCLRGRVYLLRSGGNVLRGFPVALSAAIDLAHPLPLEPRPQWHPPWLLLPSPHALSAATSCVDVPMRSRPQGGFSWPCSWRRPLLPLPPRRSRLRGHFPRPPH